MEQPAALNRPTLKAGCRLSPLSNPDNLLLIPEGALRLRGPGRRIVELCDGQRSLGDIVQTLQAEYSSADPSTISGEVATFLSGLQEMGAIEFL